MFRHRDFMYVPEVNKFFSKLFQKTVLFSKKVFFVIFFFLKKNLFFKIKKKKISKKLVFEKNFFSKKLFCFNFFQKKSFFNFFFFKSIFLFSKTFCFQIKAFSRKKKVFQPKKFTLIKMLIFLKLFI